MSNRNEIIEFLKSHRLYIDLNNNYPDKWVNINNPNEETKQYKRNIIAGAVGKNTWTKYWNKCVQHCSFTYDPRKEKTYENGCGITCFNTYERPTWMLNDSKCDLPEIYKSFFSHLTNKNKKSCVYLLDWLSNSLVNKNWTILCTIGEEGIGKGILGEIMRLLHGKTNYAKVRDTIFKEKFNGQMADKTLVYVDEVSIKNKDGVDRLKDTINNYVEIENKGKDAINKRNFANFYLSSNSYDAIKMGAGDRRFSIIDLTDTPLKNTELIGRIESEILNPSNIALLGRYLLNRTIKNNMYEPYKGIRADEVKEAGLNEWEYYVAFDWANNKIQGNQYDIKSIKAELKMEFPYLKAPGRRKFEELCKKYPDKMSFHRVGKDWFIRII